MKCVVSLATWLRCRVVVLAVVLFCQPCWCGAIEEVRACLDLLGRMTLEEKIGQLTLYTSTWAQTGPTLDANYLHYIRQGRCGAVFNAMTASYTRSLQRIAVEQSRLKIPLLFGYDVIHGHRTIFPIPLAEACSWNLEAIERSARIAAIEAAAEGIHWTFAPMVDVARDPRWGRVSEGAGEDVWLGCQIAHARVRGFQGGDLSAPDTILACAKHFAAYGAAQAGRDYHSVDLSERTLEEIYLPPFEACVKAGARTFMTAFNDLNGIPCTGNRALLTDLLRSRWGFTGVVVTDYTSINELIPHGFATDLRQAAQLAIEAGVDMDMQGGAFLTHLAELVRVGIVSEQQIDQAVLRVLQVKQQLGLFDDPYRYCDEERERRVVFCEEHLRAAEDLARQSLVLLQNESRTLPLQKTLTRVAVIGPLAESRVDLLGNWHGAGDENKVETILERVREKLGAGCQVRFVKGCDVTGTRRLDVSGVLQAVADAEAIILVLGEHEHMSGEAASRADLDLPGRQNELAELVGITARRAGKPVAAVLVNGRPLVLTRLSRAVPAILEAWFPGTRGARAIADVVFGDAAPVGKLVMTFPRCVGQVPIFYGMKNTGRPFDAANKYTSKYLDVENTPLFPFGHGLSYTTFSYAHLKLDQTQISSDDTLRVTVDVTNSGDRAGTDVVQLYLRDHVGSVTRPVKELKGFARVALAPGETRAIEFRLSADDLAFLRADMTRGVEPGTCSVMVGGSSETLLAADF
ncbi:MAG TPA: beta-glucosidase BglX, partial [Candidatus Ozemobacteraceae bacterium]|nr:beta-glucosidase BglX [Candidatus Ozemobacteraceae bacterium]